MVSAFRWLFIRARARVADGRLALVSRIRSYEQLWRSRRGLSQADGQEADAHLTCSLNQLLNRSACLELTEVEIFEDGGSGALVRDLLRATASQLGLVWFGILVERERYGRTTCLAHLRLVGPWSLGCRSVSISLNRNRRGDPAALRARKLPLPPPC